MLLVQLLLKLMENKNKEDQIMPQPSPGVFPMSPQIPPLNTCIAVLQDLGMSPMFNSDLPGIPPSFQYAQEHYEYINAFTIDNNSPIRIFSASGLRADFTSRGPSTLPVDAPTLRSLAVTGLHEVEMEVTYHLYAIKPEDTNCLIRISWLRREDSSDSNQEQRTEMLLWDVGANPSQTITVKIPSSQLYKQVYENPRIEFYPYYHRYKVFFELALQNTYMNGSLYPPNFTIFVFSAVRMNGFILRCPTVGSFQRLNL